MAKKNDIYKNLKDAINEGTTVGFKYGATSKNQLSESYANLYRSYLSIGNSIKNGDITVKQADELSEQISNIKQNLYNQTNGNRTLKREANKWERAFNSSSADSVRTEIGKARKEMASGGGSSRGAGGTSTSNT